MTSKKSLTPVHKIPGGVIGGSKLLTVFPPRGSFGANFGLKSETGLRLLLGKD